MVEFKKMAIRDILISTVIDYSLEKKRYFLN